MSLGPWLLALIAVGGVAYLLLVTTLRGALHPTDPLALSAALTRDKPELEVIVKHPGKAGRVSITSISVDRDFAERVGLDAPPGFELQPFSVPVRSEYEADLEQLAESGVELNDEALGHETTRQFAAEGEMIRTLNETTVHYAGCLAVLSGETTVVKFPLSQLIPADGKLLIGYSYRLGLGGLDSSQSIRVILSDDPSAKETVSADHRSQTTVTLRVPSKPR